ncbi:MAG: hypothetical protein V3U11_05125 [Planctomycetota bacterium]
MRTARSLALWFLLPLACLFPVGCEVLDSESSRKAEVERQAVTRRWEILRDLVEAFSGTVEDGGRRIAAASDDLAIKRLSVRYRMRATETVRQFLWFDRPAEALLDLWTLCVQLRFYFGEGDGKNTFGSQQSIVMKTTQQILDHVEVVMRSEIKTVDFDTAKKHVHEFAREHRITGSYARFGQQPSEVPHDDKAGLLSWMPSLSLNPFGGVGKGIGEGAQAIQAFNRVADRFTDVVDFLPKRLGWRLELMQYDLAESRLMRETQGSFARATAAVEDVAKTARELPESVRVELEKALASINPELKEVRDTLVQAKEASVALDKTGATYDKTARSIQAMAQQLDTTLQTFQKLVVFLAGTDDPDTEPFDILDYDKTARSITAGATQLREILTAFQQLVADDRLGGRVADAGRETQKVVDAMVWSVVLGILASVAAILLMLVGYRRITRRQPDPQPEPQQPH